AELQFDQLPWLGDARALAAAGLQTGASARNWQACRQQASVAAALPAQAQTLVTDPQTSGGLLIACAEDAAAQVLALLQDEGLSQAARIGRLHAGPVHVAVG